MLHLYNDVPLNNYYVCHCVKNNEVWEMEIHELDQNDARNGLLYICTLRKTGQRYNICDNVLT